MCGSGVDGDSAHARGCEYACAVLIVAYMYIRIEPTLVQGYNVRLFIA